MNLEKNIAAQLNGLDFARLIPYLASRRYDLLERLSKTAPEVETALLRGRIAELNDLLSMPEAIKATLERP